VSAAVGERAGAVDLTRFAWWSIAAAVTTIALKAGAYLITGSVGLLSDAAESGVNLVAAIVALTALRVAARPADHNHDFGHGKAEYFSAGVEGLMIFIAAALILLAAVERLLHPRALQSLGLGLGISAVAAGVNGVIGVILIRAGRAHRSAALAADGRHLMTDVWTSVGVLAGVFMVAVTGWERLDPIVAILVGLNILYTGYRLIQQSVVSLLDAALPASDLAVIEHVLARHRGDEVAFTGDHLWGDAAGRLDASAGVCWHDWGEQARSMAILAAAKVDAGGSAPERSRAVSAAKVKIADAARLVSQESVQLHGGMGMSEELKISHTFRRLTMIAQRFGDADHHLERYAALA